MKQKISSAISSGDPREVEKIVLDISETRTRKEKKSLYEQMNAALVKAAFEENQPELLSQLVEPPKEEVFGLARRVAGLYRENKDEAWFSAIFTLVDKLDRKSHQSDILAEVSCDLVQAGVDTGDIHFIEKGEEAFDQISIRKYRSAILSDIIPLFIQYGQKYQNVDIMHHALQALSEIGDISKQSQLHADVARAIAGFGIESGDIRLVVSGILSATEINQKIRRTNSIADIADAAWKSPLKKEISDIEQIIDSLSGVPEERITEVLAILTEHLLDRQRDKKQVYTRLLRLDDEKPWAGQTLVLELLKKAERSGERWYLEKAFEFNARSTVETQLPIEEIVLSGIAVVEKSGNPTILLDIAPLIDESCDVAKAAQLYRQITDALSRMGDFYHAIEVMKKASTTAQRINAQFFDTSVRLIKEGIRRDETGLVRENILAALEIDIADSLVHQAVTDFCKEYDFDEVVGHIPAIKELAGSHQAQDTLLLECNTILIERGFVRQKDPSGLVSLVSQIEDQTLREQAISAIVVEMARIGVARKDRDLLRRATALTCEIMDQQARAGERECAGRDAGIAPGYLAPLPCDRAPAGVEKDLILSLFPGSGPAPLPTVEFRVKIPSKLKTEFSLSPFGNFYRLSLFVAERGLIGIPGWLHGNTASGSAAEGRGDLRAPGIPAPGPGAVADAYGTRGNRHFLGYLSMYFGPSILLCHLPLCVSSGGAGRFCLLCGSRIV
ncbi:hypothetical protein [Methanoculleus bourgensis]|nr:hypothetical protein [Methanoculleus bourgensis]